MASCQSLSPGPVRPAQLVEAENVAKTARGQHTRTGGGLFAMLRTAGREAGGAAAPATEEPDTEGPGNTVAHRMTLLHTRLPNHARDSSSKVPLGHILASGNRLWHRGASRKEDVGNTGADDFTLESKFSGGATCASAPEADVTDELHTKDLKGEDSQQPPQNNGEHSGPHQHHHLRFPWQNALHSMRQQHQQHETEKQGKQNDLHKEKLDGESQSELPKQTAVDQQRLGREGIQQAAAIKEDVYAEEHSTAPESVTSYVPSRLKEQNPATEKAEHISEHPCGTSTCVHRQGGHEFRQVCSSVMPSLEETLSSTLGGVPSLSSSSSSRASSKKSAYERREEDSSKHQSIEGNSSSGEESSKVVNASEDEGYGGEKSDGKATSGGKDKDSSREGSVTPAVLPNAAASPCAPHSISDTSSRTAGTTPGDTEANRQLCISAHILGGGDALVGVLLDEKLPPPRFDQPPSADAGHSLPSSAVCPALHASVASSPTVSASTPAANEVPSPAATAATSPSNVIPAVGRLKKSVGLLRMQHGRTPPAVDSPAKEGGEVLARKEATGSQAVETASAGIGVRNKLPSHLLLRQLRPRALRESQPRAATLDKSPAHADSAAGVSGEKRELLLQGPGTTAAAQTVQIAGGKKTGEAERSPGVLRASKTLTDVREGGDEGASSHAGTAAGGRGTALRRSGGRRVSSLGSSDTAVDGGSGHVKTVRFGSMSVHVYAREARIRSCSSDSLNFALALDPAASHAQWTDACDMSDRTSTYGGRDALDYFDSHPATDEDDEGYTDEDDEELARGHHERVVGLFRPVEEGRRAEGAAAAEREPGRGAWDATTNNGNTSHRGSSWNARFGGRLTGPFSKKVEEGATAAAPAEQEAYKQPSLKHGGSSGSSSSTLERYPSFFEEIYGRPDESICGEDSRGKSDRYMNPSAALHPEQLTRQDAVQACRVSDHSTLSARDVGNRDISATAVENRPILGRESDSDECRAVAAAPGLPPTHRAGAATANGSLRMQGAEESQRGTSSQIRPESSSNNASEPSASVCGSSSVAKAEATGSGWWRRLLSSSSSSELELGAPASKPLRRRKARQEQTDQLKSGKSFATEAPRDVTHMGLVRQVDTTAPAVAPISIAAGGCSGETLRKEGGVSVASNWEQQRLKVSQSGEMGQEEKARGQEPEGNDSNLHRTRFLKAFFHKQIGWHELWMHGKEGRKGIGSAEKGMESQQRRPLVGGGPRRVYSDEYSLSASSNRQLPRRQSEGAIRRGHGEEEIQRAELKLPPNHPGKEVVVCPSGTQAEPGRCTDACSALFSPMDVIERDSVKDIHEEQNKSVHSDTPVSHVKQCSTDLCGSPTCVSCSSTLASSDLDSKNSSVTVAKGMSSRWSSQGSLIGEQVPGQDLHTASSVNSVPSSHSTFSQQSAASKHLVSADAAAAQQHDVLPPEYQQQLLLHRHLQKQEHMPIRRHVESRSSVLSTSSAGRSHTEEEALCKAAEEAIARSATSMSAEEKENLKDILKGWCS